MIQYYASKPIARNLEGFIGAVEPDKKVGLMRGLENSVGNRLGLHSRVAKTLCLRLDLKVAYNSTLRLSLRNEGVIGP